MNRALVLLVTGTFWALMMTALVRREILPYFEYQAPPTYRSMFRDRRQPELERRAVYFGTEKRGHVESLFEPLPNGHYRTRTRIDIRLTVGKMGDFPLAMRWETNVDAAFQLADFAMETDLVGMPFKMSGFRRGDKLIVKTGGGVPKGAPSEIDFPRDMTLGDGFVPYAGGAKLAVGKKWLVTTLDMTLAGVQPTRVFARVERRESKKWRGKEVPCYVVEIRKRENDDLAWHTLWVNEEGVVLVEQMTFDKLLYTVVLEEKQVITPDQAKAWIWDPKERKKSD